MIYIKLTDIYETKYIIRKIPCGRKICLWKAKLQYVWEVVYNFPRNTALDFHDLKQTKKICIFWEMLRFVTALYLIKCRLTTRDWTLHAHLFHSYISTMAGMELSGMIIHIYIYLLLHKEEIQLLIILESLNGQHTGE